MPNRRNFIKQAGSLTAGSLVGAHQLAGNSHSFFAANSRDVLTIDPTPRFEISKLLFMQFMEPLGSTEPSVEGAWNYRTDNWREDFIACVKDLAPDMIRWGGIYNRYYKWKEGVGPVNQRPSLYNHQWGGKETNRVGTHEIMDFCRRVGADPILGVNFESDGVPYFKHTAQGENRVGSAEEAADWVSYCNDPSNRQRKANGQEAAFGVRHWQLGNESSYINTFTQEEYIETMLRFARKMKERDPSIQLIGWGDAPDCARLHPDEPLEGNEPWAGAVAEAGENYLDYVAFHMMGMYPRRRNSVVKGYEYLKDPAQAWEELTELGSIPAYRVNLFREHLQKRNSSVQLAITEGHLSLSPYNINTILMSWLSAGYHARCLNTYLRNADLVRICTASDFNGSRWTVNSVMMPQPGGNSFLTPVGHLMKWYNREKGTHGIQVSSQNPLLDIAGTIDGDQVYLHVCNTSYSESVCADIRLPDSSQVKGTVLEMAPEDRMQHIDQTCPNVFEPVVRNFDAKHCFPPASVSIIKFKV